MIKVCDKSNDELVLNMSLYLLELSLLHLKILKYSPSQIAASSLYISIKLSQSISK